MNEGLEFAKLAHRLISDLTEAEANDTSDTPLELKQVRIILESFNDVADIVEKRMGKEYDDQHKRAGAAPGEDSEDGGAIN